MSYGRILYNNIKEYTPKWFKTIPYEQTTKPTFGKQPQIVSNFNANPTVKRMWRFVGRNIQVSPWMWQVVIFVFAFGCFHIAYDPVLYLYKFNNKHRTLQAALIKERAFKKAQRQKQQKEEADAKAAESQ